MKKTTQEGRPAGAKADRQADRQAGRKGTSGGQPFTAVASSRAPLNQGCIIRAISKAVLSPDHEFSALVVRENKTRNV